MALLPNYNEVPSTFPATVLYEFRTASFVSALDHVDGARASCWPSCVGRVTASPRRRVVAAGRRPSLT